MSMKKYGKNYGVVCLSKTSKMPCSSWSLQAGTTCPGSRYNSGEVCGICKHCYATKGFYCMPDAQRVRINNGMAWKEESFVSDFIIALDNVALFRWFDSGDIVNAQLAEKIYNICKATPHCLHWIPTKSYVVPSILPWIEKLESLDNVVVRRSAREIDQPAECPTDKNSCTVNSSDQFIGVECPAYKQNGKCGSCRACWNKSIKNISYHIH